MSEVDLVVPTAALPLVFARHYRSDAARLGPLGWSWVHNHDVFLRELDAGDVVRHDGELREEVFRRNGRSFEPPDSVFEALEAVEGQPHAYEITAAGGLVQRFERPAGWTDAARVPLVAIRDRHHNRIHYAYDAQGRVIEARDDDGRSLRFRYDGRGLLARVEDHAGRKVVFTYDPSAPRLTAAGRAARSDEQRETRRIYRYGDLDAAPERRRAIVAVEDGEGRALVSNEYSELPGEAGLARLALVGQTAGGHAWRYVFTPLRWATTDDPSFNVPSAQVEVQGPDGGVTLHTFNRHGDLLDRRFRLSRDGSGRVVAWTYGFDRRRNLTRIVHPDGGQEVRVYDEASPDPRMRGRLLRREIRARAGFLAQDRVVWRATYEPRYQLIASEIDESGGETRYRYDLDVAPGPGATGKLAEIEHPVARLPDGALQPAVTRLEWSARGQVTAVVTPRGSRHEIEYGSAGPERGMPVLRRRDAGDLAVEERYGYDAFGFLCAVTDGTAATRLVERDAEGQVTRSEAPAIEGRTAPRVTRRDSNGLITAALRPRGELADGVITGAFIEDRFLRDALGHIVRAEYGANTANPRVIEQRVRWDGLPVRITAPSETTIQIEYDERGLPLVERVARAGGASETIRRVFDVVGRLERQTRTRRGGGQDTTARYSYDAFGRIHRIDRSDGTILRYTWGPRDLLLREESYAASGDGTVRVLVRRRYEYDERARLVRAFEVSARADGSEAGAPLEHQFYFDEDGDLAWIVDPRGGEQTFEHDGLGRVIRYIDPRGNAQQAGYDAAGRMTSLAFQSLEPGGDIAVRALRFEHDARGRWIRIVEPDGAELRTVFDDRDLPVRTLESGEIVRRRRFGLMGEPIGDAREPDGRDQRSRWDYDVRARPVGYTAPSGEVTRYAYDDLDADLDPLGHALRPQSGAISAEERLTAPGAPEHDRDREREIAILARLAAGASVPEQGAAPMGPIADGSGSFEEPSWGEILAGAGGAPAPVQVARAHVRSLVLQAPRVALAGPAVPPAVYGVAGGITEIHHGRCAYRAGPAAMPCQSQTALAITTSSRFQLPTV